MDYATIAAWGCNTIVILGVGSYIVFEILKRWRVGLRLSALDESLLQDEVVTVETVTDCLLYTSPSPRDVEESRMPSSA